MAEIKSPKKKLAGVFILISILFLSWLLGRYCRIDTDILRNFLSKFPVFYSGAIFILLYVIFTFFIWFSKDVFRVVGAILFGAYLSSIFVFLAEMINAAILFKLSRILGREFVKKQLKGNFANLDRRIYKFGFPGMFFLRIVPLVPFRFLDLAAGLTSIPFRQYFLVVALGSPLRIFWLQFVLAAVGLGVFKDSNLLVEFLLNNRIFFIFSFIYLIASIIAMIIIRRVFLEREKRV